ncbi:MAG: low molecular weight phosphotyrosine protein phosphatase [Chloroflexota bacterium]
MPSVLFVCTANQFRSPLAAGLLLQQFELSRPEGDWRVESAGTWTPPGIPATQFVVRAARELGLRGLENHRTRQVDFDLLSGFDLCIVMEAGHKEALENEFPSMQDRIHLLAAIVEGIPYDIPDPVKPDTDPNEVARELKTLICNGSARIIRLARSLAR